MTDFDPQTVPVRPAATVMLIDDRPDLQLFMMERHANTVFAGGMWVFPGGAVDHQDDSDYFEDFASHRDDPEASRIMGLESGGLAYYMAAIRETFEEAGILLALHSDSEAPLQINETSTDRFQALRDDLNNGDIDLRTILDQEQLLADVGQMHYVARWITPLGSPRRFDARFFIAQIPSNQLPVHDDGELVNSCWMAPEEILVRAADEEDDMILMTPTLRMVKCLSDFTSSAEVIEAVSSNLPDHRARVHRESREILLPGDTDYESGLDDIESGWVRLRKPD